MTRTFSCVVVGEETLAAECTRLLLERGHRVAAVVFSGAELVEWAGREGLPTIQAGPGLADRLAPLSFDYLFSIANLRMLPDEVLALPAALPINFHDGPLPRHAGLYATSWAILEGEKEHGVTWHVMTREADTGDVLKQVTVPVDPAATAHDLDLACFEAGVESFAELVDELARGTATRTPQDLGERTYHGKYDGPPHGGLFDWRRPSGDLDALVRATTFGRKGNGFGVALLAAGSRLIAVRGVETTGRPSTLPPGTVVEAAAEAITVATVDHDVRLTDLASLDGDRLDPRALARDLDRDHGGRFTEPSEDDVAALAAAGRAALREEERWLRRLGALEPLLPPRLGALAPVGEPARPVALPPALRPDDAEAWAIAAVLAFLARLVRGGEHDVALSAGSDVGVTSGLVAADVPFRAPDAPLDRTLPDLAALVGTELDRLAGRSPARGDLPLRRPGVTALRLPVAVLRPGAVAADRPLTIRVDEAGTVTFTAEGGREDWLAARYALFLDAAAAAPTVPLGDLPLLTDAERASLANVNDTAEDYPRDRTVSALVADVACAAPAAVAVRFEGRDLTYAALDEAADALAHKLIGLGAGPGGRVGVYLERSAELVVALLAVMKTGAAYVPIDPVYPPARIGHMLADSGTALVVTDAALAGTLDEIPDGRAVTRVVADLAGTPSGPPVDRSDPDAAAYVIYTSGSTGVPKGVQVGHRALVNFLWTMARRPGFGSADSLLALTTVCFDIAGLELYLPLVRGGTVEVLPADVCADGFALRERIERSAPSVLQATPTTWQMLIAAGWPGDPGLRALCGGEALSAELAGRLSGLVGELHNMYGPTETTIWSTVDRVLPGEAVTIGRPIGNTRCHTLDERGVPVPPGVPGELYLSGDGVADGYLGRPDLTAERFVTIGEGRAYRTGDLVRWLPDGRLEYLERIDGQVKLHGHRIELGEVESALRRLPGIESAVAVIREDRPGDRALAAYATVRDGTRADPAELRAALRDRLPGYMVPATVTLLPSLPLTPNGKVDRKALPEPRAARPAGPAAPARTDLERRIAAAWCEVLGADAVGVEDNFFDRGGDSLKLTSVVALLRRRLGRPVTRLDMFGHPTVRAMAAHLAGDADAEPVQRRSRNTDALARRRDRRRGTS
ncbi:amino acid adenylation domain-containing protein [Actinomadura rayongensis]|uniref:Amino acid adenylation domain-containing protein n=1 Tax=Actinomadura rayongensis TaxID=1429076 RepID=A0A6I4WC37_9ACTN|nr:amino acid adenylation domain-containing protein [Actinomadura rayongensis]MXQ65566.1 amino acid adenylation domain-containing protein [Actinomadura rayongensis]